ncbi:MAG: membrane protein insertase YidC [Flavobacterium sp.]|jgi:YidC/Oxa1 family membrane protein insertase|uniref:membrane protein insertase YidC n=1 Tax=Flavobacterium sp. TaxID=239 RepID=UPI001B67423E|nr:membrane protein insertase YidC [Flavobacterium sp.]MBP9848951.1 membrane protein insertase YidC [Flavobacterium sp.]TAF09020.1 MAG: membrane protein insertase YidC [Flavobacteriia bacterium]WRH74062.1 MAG: membrane protein insertase YidC [Flavobacterium sp.]
MEEKKLDLNSIIGFVLISGILIWMLYSNAPTPEEQKEKEKKEQLDKQAKEVKTVTSTVAATPVADSTNNAATQAQLGSFGYSATLPSATDAVTEIKNEVLSLKISNKGGYITEATVLGFDQFEKNSKKAVQIIKDKNASLDIALNTTDNRTLHTKDMYFEPKLTTEGKNQVLTLQLKAGPDQFLEYRYVLKPNEYMLDFAIRSQGLEKVVNTSKPLDLEWQLKSYRNEKSISYENRYTELVFEYEDDKDDYLNAAKDSEDEAKDVSYIAFKQHLFTSILLTDTKFKTAKFKSDNLVDDEEIDTVFTKNFTAQVPLEFKNGALNYNMNWYYGPSDYTILNDYEKNLDEIMPLGWGIFGWINRYIFIPVFGFISALGIGYGIAIILFTILVRIVMSPVTYKSYLSQAKMKVLRPEIAELNEKFKDNPMKKQQETMKLYSKAGVNPMAGCLPALMQMPIFYALFQFFPSMFDLRQKSFLWADDLSSFDAVLQLPFHIPFYGSHVSLFPILASIAIFFYMKMTTGDQAMSTPPQEGMPDMGKIMKIMIYISPIMMLFFFNNYASGLSLYYFVSNLITIGIMLVIKNYIVKEDKIHAQIQENKTKEKTESKFQRKMREMMEQAEAQKAAQKKK